MANRVADSRLMFVKTIHHASIVGQEGINLIERIVLQMGFVWNATHLEAGIDGYIELRDGKSGEVTNNILQVQSKATEQPFERDDGKTFEYLCSERDLEYWLAGNAPVILVRSRPKTNEAYWVSIKDYFTDLAKRKQRRVIFDKEKNRFDSNAKSELIRSAVPSDSGFYLGPTPKEELLYANLLRLGNLPRLYYTAYTDYRTRPEIFERFRELTTSDTVGEWILNDKKIYSFYDLTEFPWNRLCDVGTVDDLPTNDWSTSNDEVEKRRFVHLLNSCLREKLYRRGVIFSRENKYYYFRATRDLRELKYSYRSLEHQTSRFVFKGYPKKKDHTQMAYYRHSAFAGRFVRHDSEWLLQLNPTYHYTFDGSRPYFYSADQLSGIKRLENNSAVLGQVIMWGRFLSERSLFDRGPIFLDFPAITRFPINVGFEDAEWLPDEEPDKRLSLVDKDNDRQGDLF